MDFKKLKSLTLITFGGTVAFGAMSIYKQSEGFMRDIVMPVIRLLDPEAAHNVAILIGKYGLIPKSNYMDHPSLKVKLFGKELSNPIGIAAGFDKHGEAVTSLTNLGFGFVEIGSVTPEPQAGNAKPRVFRLEEDKAVINRYGFNSDGHSAVLKRLQDLRADKTFTGVVGVNLGKNKNSVDPVNDYVLGVQCFSDVADYLVINISSPNTPGLRDMQQKSSLEALLKTVVRERNNLGNKPPIFLKLGPDLSHIERKNIANVIKSKDCRVDGLIISNTTVERPESLQSANKHEIGGLSGEPVRQASTEMIAEMYKLTGGSVTIIGVGGVATGADAYDKIKAGATSVQIYTSLVYEGPMIVTRIKKELVECLGRDNYSSLSEAVGKDVR